MAPVGDRTCSFQPHPNFVDLKIFLHRMFCSIVPNIRTIATNAFLRSCSLCVGVLFCFGLISYMLHIVTCLSACKWFVVWSLFFSFSLYLSLCFCSMRHVCVCECVRSCTSVVLFGHHVYLYMFCLEVIA